MNFLYLCADRGIPVLGAKGASAHVRQLIRGLAEERHAVLLLCAKLGEGNPMPPCAAAELPPAATAVDVDAEAARRGIGADDRARRDLAKILDDRMFAGRVVGELERRAARVDAIYERYALFHRAGEDVARRLGVPRILEVNAPLADEQRRYRGLHLQAEAEAAERAILAGADHIVAVSDVVRDHAVACGVARERISVIPNAVDPAHFSPAADGTAVRARFGLAGARIVGFVGSLKPWHGMDFLIDGFRAAAAVRPDAALLVVGDGPGLPAMRDRVEREGLRGRVTFAGAVCHADVPSYIAAMDVCAAPYESGDGFYFSPLKVVEYLAVGRPVVAPRAGELPSVVRDGESGMLYEPGDLDAFTRALGTLLDDGPLAARMGARAAEDVGATRTWRANAAAVAHIADGLARARTAKAG